MRNKAKGFPYEHTDKIEGEPRAKAEYASKRADGTINTHPQERMKASSQRNPDEIRSF
ncbi:small, acid-soluble spore protein K [Neobacillus notoginsengisoli]|uniref:Small, acid-soluble spore protein K n=1 Tax=Neobacillus notoginsengisoli TaxID=1578198 RepID=A0A417YJQ3_9BACI|nr:small, acid-soluble spore protein K [Neobacillus notoginsengisoli]RHW33347.1 small, acid-soluble spore protein K [Neobacillus notoginsengisoli]